MNNEELNLVDGNLSDALRQLHQSALDARNALNHVRDELSILRDAGRAVVARWDSPLWKDAGPTAEVIDRLRKALESDNG